MSVKVGKEELVLSKIHYRFLFILQLLVGTVGHPAIPSNVVLGYSLDVTQGPSN